MGNRKIGIEMNPYAPTCKGRIFRGRSNVYVNKDGMFVNKVSMVPLKSLSCPGCEHCGPTMDTLREDLTLSRRQEVIHIREHRRKNPGFPKVVTICGSSRFINIMATVGWILERDEGVIVQSLHLLPWWYSPEEIPHHLAEVEGFDDHMDKLHLNKILMSDEVFVVDWGNYTGKSTDFEVEFAEGHGVQVRRITDQSELKIMNEVMERLEVFSPPDQPEPESGPYLWKVKGDTHDMFDPTIDDAVMNYLIGTGFLPDMDEEVFDLTTNDGTLVFEQYRRREVDPNDIPDPLDSILESLDDEYGSPDGQETKPTVPMKTIRDILVERVIRDYVVWDSSPTGKTETVDVRKWMEDHRDQVEERCRQMNGDFDA